MTDPSRRVLVWAPRGRDGQLAAHLIQRHGLTPAVVDSVDAVVDGIADAGCAVIASDALTAGVRARLHAALDAQPPWSDFPIIVIANLDRNRPDEALAAVRTLGNVSMLPRPVQGGALVSALTSALRARRRQFEGRDAIVRRDQFLAMLGHELRNPLAAITLAVDRLDGTSDLARARAILERQSRHLSRLVDDLLDVARVTSGKVQVQLEPIDLGEIVRRCVEVTVPTARARGLVIEVHVDRALPVLGDTVRLEEVFSNLIANAIKYSPPGAKVTVTARIHEDNCVVEVSDTGIGIAPEMVTRVFDLFAQANVALARSEGGLGLGLTLVKAIVQLHHGRVTAASPGLGKGSTFTVELPAAPHEVADTSSATPFQIAERNQRVLVVDDNEDLLDMTRDLLESSGCEVWCATDGIAALDKLVDTRPDVAFVDIGLPKLEGYGVATQARARGVTSYLVAMTGYGQPEDRRRAFAAGFDRHLTKPANAQALFDALEAAAAARRDTRGTGQS